MCPSLPGYGFSDRPARPGRGVQRMARAWIALMAWLGYQRYGALGGDWGTGISTIMGRQVPRPLDGRGRRLRPLRQRKAQCEPELRRLHDLAVAMLAGEPLLCLGDDFPATDLELAGLDT